MLGMRTRHVKPAGLGRSNQPFLPKQSSHSAILENISGHSHTRSRVRLFTGRMMLTWESSFSAAPAATSETPSCLWEDYLSALRRPAGRSPR
jgi:hypothetical protein